MAAPLASAPPGAGEVENTMVLLSRAQRGDAEATNRLVERCLPPLRRWARGRLPDCARDALDTEDLVQDTVMAVLRRLDGFEARHEGALQAYLRQALVNRIRDVIRSRKRRPSRSELPDDLMADQTSPLERLLGQESIERYEAAIQKLRATDREAIVGRLELNYSYAELAVALGRPSANAARVAVTRAVVRLAKAMEHGR
jgi:RNA polymerase sigma-70 factor (ECF subfamily)